METEEYVVLLRLAIRTRGWALSANWDVGL